MPGWIPKAGAERSQVGSSRRAPHTKSSLKVHDGVERICESAGVAKIDLFQHAEDYVTFSAGSVIFEEGQPGDTMYAVVAGEVDIVFRDRVLETCGAGAIVGELALIDRSARSASAIARTDCKLVPVDAKRFQYMISQTPFFALQVMRIMAERLRRWTVAPDREAG